MGTLDDFNSKKFADQMNILSQIGKDKDRLYLPELFTLHRDLTGDKTVDAMVEHTLRDVLSVNEADTVRKLITGVPKEKRLCLQVAGRRRFASAVPALIDSPSLCQDHLLPRLCSGAGQEQRLHRQNLNS